MKAMVRRLRARTGSRSIRAATNSCSRSWPRAARAASPRRPTRNSHWGGIVYAKRTGAEADAAQADADRDAQGGDLRAADPRPARDHRAQHRRCRLARDPPAAPAADRRAGGEGLGGMERGRRAAAAGHAAARRPRSEPRCTEPLRCREPAIATVQVDDDNVRVTRWDFDAGRGDRLAPAWHGLCRGAGDRWHAAAGTARRRRPRRRSSRRASPMPAPPASSTMWSMRATRAALLRRDGAQAPDRIVGHSSGHATTEPSSVSGRYVGMRNGRSTVPTAANGFGTKVNAEWSGRSSSPG